MNLANKPRPSTNHKLAAWIPPSTFPRLCHNEWFCGELAKNAATYQQFFAITGKIAVDGRALKN